MKTAPALLALGAMVALCGATAAHAQEPAPEDPPACREAIAAHPDEGALTALARAEEDLATRARQARTGAQKVLRKHLAADERAGLAASDAAEPLLHQAADLRREGKGICHCRQRRGDPNRQDCEYLYPEPLP